MSKVDGIFTELCREQRILNQMSLSDPGILEQSRKVDRLHMEYEQARREAA